MCFTGGFALAMMVDDAVVAPVLSQPSLPLPLTTSATTDLGLSARRPRPGARTGGRRVVRARSPLHRGQGQSPRAVRTPPRLLGDAFVGVEIDSSTGNPHGHRKTAHSVLTDDLDDRPGTPTRAALDQVLAFFKDRLPGEPPGRGWRARGQVKTLGGRQIFTVDIPSRGRSWRPHCWCSTASRLPRSTSIGWSTPWPPDRRVLLFDMLGYGLSDKPDLAYGFDLQADWPWPSSIHWVWTASGC